MADQDALRHSAGDSATAYLHDQPGRDPCQAAEWSMKASIGKSRDEWTTLQKHWTTAATGPSHRQRPYDKQQLLSSSS
eukprot:6188767-Pyramimonas_sp.AAC.1